MSSIASEVSATLASQSSQRSQASATVQGTDTQSQSFADILAAGVVAPDSGTQSPPHRKPRPGLAVLPPPLPLPHQRPVPPVSRTLTPAAPIAATAPTKPLTAAIRPQPPPAIPAVRPQQMEGMRLRLPLNPASPARKSLAGLGLHCATAVPSLQIRPQAIQRRIRPATASRRHPATPPRARQAAPLRRPGPPGTRRATQTIRIRSRMPPR